MALSIFSSEKRVLLTFVTAILITALLALLNVAIYLEFAKGKDGTEAEKKFWRGKVKNKQQYDMVFTGDSRTLCGIDPQIFDDLLGNKSYNAAFTGGGINKEILEHIDRNLLNKNGAEKAVILGITPMSMAANSRGNGHYSMLKKELKEKESIFSEWLEILFSEIRTKEIKELFRKRVPDKIYHRNGYLEKISAVKPKARRSNLHGYKVYFNDYTFSPESVKEILFYAEQWKKENVTVFAFRLPTMPEMDVLEDSFCKESIDSFRKHLIAAGGVWLEVKDRSKYNSYDGSHLERTDAGKLSHDLAEQIKKYFDNAKCL
ncbi:MAG: hypothetical protein IKD10_12475 [Lentisphaeria bacterium]|nr:hypothetical protein [Lentisphaeria bacterium]